MSPGDLVRLSWGALRAHRVRTRLTYAAIAIGAGSVLVLTALGQGAQDWIITRFASLGSSVLIVIPGRTETRGGPPLAPATTRDLTIEDMEEVRRRVPGVRRTVPIVVGEATARFGGRGRACTVIGSTRDFLAMREVPLEIGEDLPETDARVGTRVCIIGRTIHRELFRGANPLGSRIRLGDYSFRVVGVITQRGQSQMMDVDEIVLVPVANAMRMFNRSGLFRLVVQTSSSADLELARSRVAAILRGRHDGEEDFTILTPGALAASLKGIIGILTAALAGIASVSLAVAGIGVMNVMVVAVAERAGEIGLMKAVGASNGQVLAVFLSEAVALTTGGGLVGIVGGIVLTGAAGLVYPDIPFRVPGWAIALAAAVVTGVGITFGILPAMRAARLEPLDALRRKAG